MKKKSWLIILSFLLAAAIIVGGVRVVLGSGSTDYPVAYVISDGEDYYFVDYDALIDSYVEYYFDPDSPGAALARFYYETLGSNVTDHFIAYVSGVTTQFVNYQAFIDKYVDTMDSSATYMWFNNGDATPAFPVITKVWVLDANAVVSGRYYVNTNGYIIRRSTYELDTTAPSDAPANVPAEFTVSVTSNDLGCDTLTGSLCYEITGGSYTLEVENGGVWQTVTDGTLGSATSITPDWSASVNVRFTPSNTGTYSLKFMLKTTADEVLAEKTESITVTGAMQLSAVVPTFRVDTTAQFSLTTTANGDAGRIVQTHFTIPSGATVEYLDSGSGNWLTLPAVYGPTEGFAVADGTMSLRASFSEAGAKTINAQVVEVGTGTVLADKDIEIMVEQPMTVSVALPTFYAGEPATFTLTTTAQDDAGKMVQAFFTVPSDVTLEYWDDATGGWLPLTGAYGPAEGFAVADATYTFRATVTGIGMKTMDVQFVEVGTSIVLTEKRFIATAEYRVQPSIIIPGTDHITINAATTTVTLNLGNPSGNTCLFVISLELEGGTVLYTSAMLAPGDTVGEVTLSQGLSPGTYTVVIRYETYDQDDLSPLNSAEVVVTMFVE